MDFSKVIEKVRSFNHQVGQDLELRLQNFLAQLVSSGDVFVYRGPSSFRTEKDYEGNPKSIELVAHSLVCYEPFREKQRLENEIKSLKDSLQKIKGLTFSWVIAEQTVDCQHTYDQIKNECDNALTQKGIDK